MFSRLASRLRDLGTFGPFLAFATVAPGGGAVALTASSALWYPALGEAALPAFILAFALLAGLSLIPTHAASLVAGMLFGSVAGSFWALTTIILAAILSYLIATRLVGDRVILALTRKPKIQAVCQELLHSRPWRVVAIIALVRISPLMPFACTNLLLASTQVRFRLFLLGSLLGMAPRVILVAVAGAGLSQVDLGQSSDRRLLFVGLLATLAVILIVSLIARSTLARLVHPPAPPSSDS